jgi:hypothetical protein
VAFGYLTVLLGYLSQLRDVAARIRAELPGQHFGALIEAIEEFISHHKKVDDLFKDDARCHNPHSSLTERLSRMLAGLRGIEESFV